MPKITLFPNYTETTGKVIDFPFAQLCRGFVNRKLPVDKKSQNVWSPTIFERYPRNKPNALYLTCIVFDCDDGAMTPQDADNVMLQSGYSYAIHTTSGSKPNHPKYRIIMPLQTPIQADMWCYTTVQANALYTGLGLKGIPDQKAIKDSARIYSLFYGSSNEYSNSNQGKTFEFDLEDIQNQHIRTLEEREIKEARKFFDEELLKLGIAKHIHIPINTLKRNYIATDAGSRKTIADRLSVKFSTVVLHPDRIANFPCPHCGQTDATFFYFDGGFARCTHKNSCIQWYDSVYSLAKHYGVL